MAFSIEKVIKDIFLGEVIVFHDNRKTYYYRIYKFFNIVRPSRSNLP